MTTHVLPGVYADYALFLFYFLASAILVYATARNLFGAKTAFFSAAFFAASPVVIASQSITLDNPACLYCTLSLYCISRSFRLDDNWKWSLAFLASGVAAALALNAHLVSIVYLGANYSIFIAYEAISRGQRRRMAARILKALASRASASLSDLSFSASQSSSSSADRLDKFSDSLDIYRPFLEIAPNSIGSPIGSQKALLRVSLSSRLASV